MAPSYRHRSNSNNNNRLSNAKKSSRVLPSSATASPATNRRRELLAFNDEFVKTTNHLLDMSNTIPSGGFYSQRCAMMLTLYTYLNTIDFKTMVSEMSAIGKNAISQALKEFVHVTYNKGMQILQSLEKQPQLQQQPEATSAIYCRFWVAPKLERAVREFMVNIELSGLLSDANNNDTAEKKDDVQPVLRRSARLAAAAQSSASYL